MNLAFAISGFLGPVITGLVLKLRSSYVDTFWLMACLAFLSGTRTRFSRSRS
jgi:hypothetical protein